MSAPKEDSTFLLDLAASRLQADAARVERLPAAAGGPAVLLALPAESADALAHLLVHEFASATGGRSRLGQLAQEVELAPASAPPADSANGGGPQPALRLAARAGSSLSWEELEELATLLLGFLDYHVHCTKSELHTGMRRRLGALAQQLRVTRLQPL